MSNLTISTRLWHRMADVIQDMGNHHPDFAGTEVGAELDVLGNAIKYGVPLYPGAQIKVGAEEWLDKASTVIQKHGGDRAGLTIIEQSIETAEKLLGLWAEPKP